MLLITTALMLEAQPLKTSLELTAVAEAPFALFNNKEILLIVTGTGAQRAAAATGWALGRFPVIRVAMNVGYAGASWSATELYRWYCINSIRDESTGRLHIPDQLLKLPFPDRPLLTVGKPVREQIPWDGLVDMEGSGFYEAARQVLPPDRILLFKWISDNLTGEIDPNDVGERFVGAIEELLPIISQITGSMAPVGKNEPEIMAEIRKRIRLTETQWKFLRKWLDGYLVRGGSTQAILELLPTRPPAGKPDNSRLFEEIKNALKG